MRLALKSDKVKFYIGDVRDYNSINFAMPGVDYVFHAAALKQVPSCEFYPLEAVKTNILGAENVMNAAIEHNVEKVIVLSTDKAVYPINAMGLSKALMEKSMVAKSRTIVGRRTVFCGTRYGNVIASRGSVIPLFIQQVCSGKTLTITDPGMTRFLMSLADAVNLVMYAFAHGQQGDIFVQKSPAATIRDIALAVMKLCNKETDIRIIGTRHGEKLYETLVTREEMAKAEDLKSYYRIAADNRDLNYGKYFEEGQEAVTHLEDYNSHNTTRLDVASVVALLGNVEEVRECLKLC
jgi:UDP-glucose 4-epimerase